MITWGPDEETQRKCLANAKKRLVHYVKEGQFDLSEWVHILGANVNKLTMDEVRDLHKLLSAHLGLL